MYLDIFFHNRQMFPWRYDSSSLDSSSATPGNDEDRYELFSDVLSGNDLSGGELSQVPSQHISEFFNEKKLQQQVISSFL